MKKLIVVFLLLFFMKIAEAQNAADTSGEFYTISKIIIKGNKKTKDYIIRRELHLAEGDTIHKNNLSKTITDAQAQVHNLNLFAETKIIPDTIDNANINIIVDLREKWYIYPTPQFQLVDRNYNEWVKTYHASLDRVIYGAKFLHYNFSGRRDELKVYLLNGYARNFSFSYSSPYSNSALNEGFGVSAGFTQNREISYRTSSNNKLLQFKNGAFVRNAFSSQAFYQMRRGLFIRHIFTLGYSYQKVVDSLLWPKYNPYYFNKQTSGINIADFNYTYVYSRTNNVNYPLTGKVVVLTAAKRGLGFTGGINNVALHATYRNFLPHGHNWYSSFELSGLLRLPFKQAYINQRAIGYGDYYMRGYEYYVVDAVASALGKYTLKKKILSFDIPMPKKLKVIPKIPFTFFGKTYTDAGYAYNKDPFVYKLNNRFLYSGGVGIDIITLYDIVLKIEYSFNQLGEKGLFLRSKGGF